MIRRFLNIVAEKGSSGLYSLHRLDVSKHLFYPSRAAAEAANKNKGGGQICSLPQLPPPIVRFDPSPTNLSDSARLGMFALVSPRSCEDRILCCDNAGHTVLYNAGSGSIQTMPPLNGDKGFMPIAISIGRPGAPEEDLYVMSSVANMRVSPFDVLRFGSRSYYRKDWHWDPLPPLPVPANIRSHTVVDGGRTICVSAAPSCGGVTYYFDTVECEWRQAGGGGGWVLPFEGRADYVPDLNLWLGFSTDSDCQQLCAWDLSAMDEPPRLQHAWTHLETPEDWSVTRSNLLHLGAGRFCLAKVFQVGGEYFDSGSVEDKFAVLTGVEMVTDGGGSSSGHGEPQMVKHKSMCYMFANEFKFIRWVL